MKAKFPPMFSALEPGVWGVDAIGTNWYVVHSKTLRAKKIGPVGGRKTNYFDVACREAAIRNQKEHK